MRLLGPWMPLVVARNTQPEQVGGAVSLRAELRTSGQGKPFFSLKFDGNSEPFAATEEYESDENMSAARRELAAHGIEVVDRRHPSAEPDGDSGP